MRVKVKNLYDDAKRAIGYYDVQRMRAGDVFDLDNPKDFSESWMQIVDEKTPLTKTKMHLERAKEIQEAEKARIAIQNLNVI